MPQLCLYLQLHQPYRLTSFSLFDLGHDRSYFNRLNHDQASNQAIFKKVAAKSYLPTLKLLLKLTTLFPTFSLALSCSGVFLEQAQEYEPEVLLLLKKLAATGQVEFLAETYYHSLASIYSPSEFTAQVRAHQKLIKTLFNQEPTTFRNTELIYSNEIAQQVQDLGFSLQLTEGVGRYLHGRSKTHLFQAHLPPKKTKKPLLLLLKHAELSDDIAFRFSDRNWQWYPLTVEKYFEWLNLKKETELVNLFMDFETFGEHQWAETGIFAFLEELVGRTIQASWFTWLTPSQVAAQASQKGELSDLPRYDVPLPISWADVDRDLTAWTENELQQDSLRAVYELEQAVLELNDPKLLGTWRQLQTSDHFYYMCTKWAADGDVHAYFSPYNSPLEAYRQFSLVLADFAAVVRQNQACSVQAKPLQLKALCPDHLSLETETPLSVSTNLVS